MVWAWPSARAPEGQLAQGAHGLVGLLARSETTRSKAPRSPEVPLAMSKVRRHPGLPCGFSALPAGSSDPWPSPAPPGGKGPEPGRKPPGNVPHPPCPSLPAADLARQSSASPGLGETELPRPIAFRPVFQIIFSGPSSGPSSSGPPAGSPSGSSSGPPLARIGIDRARGGGAILRHGAPTCLQAGPRQESQRRTAHHRTGETVARRHRGGGMRAAPRPDRADSVPPAFCPPCFCPPAVLRPRRGRASLDYLQNPAELPVLTLAAPDRVRRRQGGPHTRPAPAPEPEPLVVAAAPEATPKAALEPAPEPAAPRPRRRPWSPLPRPGLPKPEPARPAPPPRPSG